MKFDIKSVSIKWRLFIYFAIFIGIVITILWVFQIIFLDDFYKSIKISELKSAAQEIESNVGSDNLQTIVDDMLRNNETSVIVYNMTDGSQISPDNIPNNLVNNLPNELEQELYTKTEENGGEYHIGFDKDDLGEIRIMPTPSSSLLPSATQSANAAQSASKADETTAAGTADAGAQAQSTQPPDVPRGDDGQAHNFMENMIYTKIVESSGHTYFIVLNARISPVNATVQTLRTQLVIITAIMVLLAGGIAFIISKIISKPIVEINKSAKVLAGGNYNIQFGESGYREISELGKTLNYAAKELSTVEGLRRELIANISHDLRTPLTLITGYSEVMRDIPNEYTKENVQIIIDEAKRLTNIVNDTLDLSKLQSGTQELHRSRFNLTQTIESIMMRYNKLTEQDGYHIQFSYDKKAYVYADELRMSQVIYNLMNNAINYTGADKLVQVRQSTRDGWVRVEIEDTGEGIPKDKLAYIWDRYYKVDKSHKRAAVGTGLGLSIVKGILDMHEAKYGVISTEGVGSIFWFECKLAGAKEKETI